MEFPADGLFLLYTDGVIEAGNDRGELFDFRGLVECIEATHGKSAENTLNTVIHSLDSFTGESPVLDDVTFLTLRRKK